MTPGHVCTRTVPWLGANDISPAMFADAHDQGIVVVLSVTRFPQGRVNTMSSGTGSPPMVTAMYCRPSRL